MRDMLYNIMCVISAVYSEFISALEQKFYGTECKRVTICVILIKDGVGILPLVG